MATLKELTEELLKKDFKLYKVDNQIIVLVVDKEGKVIEEIEFKI